MSRVAIVAAMPGELKPLVRGWRIERSRGIDLWRSSLQDDEGRKHEWIAACAGAGVNAAARAFAEIEQAFAKAEKAGSIDLAVSIGWAGALSGKFVSGHAYCVSSVVDLRTGEQFEATFAGEAGTCDFSSRNRESGQANLRLVTSPRVADEGEKQRLAIAYNAGLVDMEAAEIARLARMREISFACIKGVSDGFTDRLPDFNRFISSNGSFQLTRFIFFVLLRPWYWSALARMGENSRKAAQSIAASLLDFLNEWGSTRERNGNPNENC